MTIAPIPEKKPRWGVRQWQWVAVGVVVSVMLLLLFSISHSAALEKSKQMSCASNLKNLTISLHMYASDWTERFPPQDGAAGLELLRSQGYCENHKMYLCYSTGTVGKDLARLTEKTVDYYYFGGYYTKDDAKLVIGSDRENNHYRYGNLVHLDGSVYGYAAGWLTFLAKAKAQHEKVVGPRRQSALSLSKGAAAEKAKGTQP